MPILDRCIVSVFVRVGSITCQPGPLRLQDKCHLNMYTKYWAALHHTAWKSKPQRRWNTVSISLPHAVNHLNVSNMLVFLVRPCTKSLMSAVCYKVCYRSCNIISFSQNQVVKQCSVSQPYFKNSMASSSLYSIFKAMTLSALSWKYWPGVSEQGEAIPSTILTSLSGKCQVGKSELFTKGMQEAATKIC